MPTRKISLTEKQDAFVAKLIASGEYQNASAIFRDAMRALQERRKEDMLKLKALRTAIKVGADALRRGWFDDVDETDLEAFLDRQSAESDKNAP